MIIGEIVENDANVSVFNFNVQEEDTIIFFPSTVPVNS
jgi:hypothetical protein